MTTTTEKKAEPPKKIEKDKALEDKYSITYDIVRQAYSDIKWGGRS